MGQRPQDSNGDFSHLEARRAYLELRFLSLNACIARMGATQVLDLATGVAPRGLVLSEDPSVLVIETDLPEMIAEKQAIVASLLPFAARPDYRRHAANALHNDELWDAAGWFGREPLTIVHEGLLMYFGAVERAQLAANIRGLLTFYGGAWDEAQAFFGDEGFTCERLRQVDLVPEMRRRVSTPEALERVESESVWVMRLRAN